jgi:hypothetical protein
MAIVHGPWCGGSGRCNDWLEGINECNNDCVMMELIAFQNQPCHIRKPSVFD